MLMICFGLSQTAAAAPVYLAPPTATSDGPRTGSATAPFVKLSQAIAAIEAGQGDHVLLQDGHYGDVYWTDITPPRMIRIAVDNPGRAHFDIMSLKRMKNLHFVNFSIWPRQPVKKMRSLVNADAQSANLIFEGFDVRGRADAIETYMKWSVEDWTSTWHSNGFFLRGQSMTIRNSTITAMDFSIQTTGPDAVVEGNHIQGFSGDGLRGIGSNNLFRNNLVQDSFKVDTNHDDGFQSWSPKRNGPDSTIENLSVVGNAFIEWTGQVDHPLHGTLQGIGLFDGFYKNVRIENNLVLSTQYHGIALYGARKGSILNNTVLHPYLRSGKFPWIMVKPHKNGTPSKNVTVRGNVAVNFQGIPSAAKDNMVVSPVTPFYQNPRMGDFAAHPDGPLVDSAFGIKFDATMLERVKKAFADR
ncbi:right-handed parallel beta-helix repeat-containing protein [Tritonibacter aquimaris]|nr:right-handed parallel beta-helix repeat-containing protein [Tritonibacter aquimaris]